MYEELAQMQGNVPVRPVGVGGMRKGIAQVRSIYVCRDGRS